MEMDHLVAILHAHHGPAAITHYRMQHLFVLVHSGGIVLPGRLTFSLGPNGTKKQEHTQKESGKIAGVNSNTVLFGDTVMARRGIVTYRLPFRPPCFLAGFCG
jgi:hypothetical protein